MTWTVEALTATVIGFYSMLVHSDAVLMDGNGKTLELLHFNTKTSKVFQVWGYRN